MARQGTLIRFRPVVLFLALLLCVPAFALPSVALAKPAHISAATGQAVQNSKPEEWSSPRSQTYLSPAMLQTPYQQGFDAGYNSKPEDWSRASLDSFGFLLLLVHATAVVAPLW